MTFHHFYPRSPCGERPGKVKVVEPGFTFLSTLSLRRATGNLVGLVRRNAHFYPRSPCGERLLDAVQIVIIVIFLSTLSLRRATDLDSSTTRRFTISIHALLAESDARRASRQQPAGDFYPRSPCGERQFSTSRISETIKFLSTLSLRRATLSKNPMISVDKIFLSTLSLRRATVHYDNYNLHCVISIHALLAESDRTQSASRVEK